jgi:predicted metal-dependent hydrolase
LISELGADLVYELVRSKRRKKTISLQIKRDGRIMLFVPHRLSEDEADGFFKGKETWVRKKLGERAAAPDSPGRLRRFLPGDEFLYHGEPYPLEIAESARRAPLILAYGTFLLRQDKADSAREAFVNWYRLRAREELPERVRHYVTRTNLVPTGITITGAITRYGSCSPADRLSFSWRIIMAPYPVIDYVILHELAHIKEKNHSKRFWDLMETLLPDYRRQKQWLRENGHMLWWPGL